MLIIGAWNYPFYLTLGPAVGPLPLNAVCSNRRKSPLHRRT